MFSQRFYMIVTGVESRFCKCENGVQVPKDHKDTCTNWCNRVQGPQQKLECFVGLFGLCRLHWHTPTAKFLGSLVERQESATARTVYLDGRTLDQLGNEFNPVGIAQRRVCWHFARRSLALLLKMWRKMLNLSCHVELGVQPKEGQKSTGKNCFAQSRNLKRIDKNDPFNTQTILKTSVR